MDIECAGALEELLHEYAGAVLYVSHDAYFCSQIPAEVLVDLTGKIDKL